MSILIRCSTIARRCSLLLPIFGEDSHTGNRLTLVIQDYTADTTRLLTLIFDFTLFIVILKKNYTQRSFLKTQIGLQKHKL
ncbi:hypothetical protein D3C81_1018160 [compost metagenome]